MKQEINSTNSTNSTTPSNLINKLVESVFKPNKTGQQDAKSRQDRHWMYRNE